MRKLLVLILLIGILAALVLSELPHRHNAPATVQATVTMPESELQQMVNEIRELQKTVNEAQGTVNDLKAEIEYTKNCVKENAKNSLPTLTCFNYDEISDRTVYGRGDVTAD